MIHSNKILTQSAGLTRIVNAFLSYSPLIKTGLCGRAPVWRAMDDRQACTLQYRALLATRAGYYCHKYSNSVIRSSRAHCQPAHMFTKACLHGEEKLVSSKCFRIQLGRLKLKIKPVVEDCIRLQTWGRFKSSYRGDLCHLRCQQNMRSFSKSVLWFPE